MSFRFFIVSFTALFGGNLLAHDPGFSTAILTIGNDQIESLVKFSRKEVDSLVSRTSSEKRELLFPTVLLVGEKSPVRSELLSGSEDDFLFHLTFPKPNAESFAIYSPLVAELNPGHRQYLLVRDGDHNLLFQRWLKSGENSVVVDLSDRLDAIDPKSGKVGIGVQVLLLLCSLLWFLALAMVLFWMAMRFGVFFGKWRSKGCIFLVVLGTAFPGVL